MRFDWKALRVVLDSHCSQKHMDPEELPLKECSVKSFSEAKAGGDWSFGSI